MKTISQKIGIGLILLLLGTGRMVGQDENRFIIQAYHWNFPNVPNNTMFLNLKIQCNSQSYSFTPPFASGTFHFYFNDFPQTLTLTTTCGSQTGNYSLDGRLSADCGTGNFFQLDYQIEGPALLEEVVMLKNGNPVLSSIDCPDAIIRLKINDPYSYAGNDYVVDCKNSNGNWYQVSSRGHASNGYINISFQEIKDAGIDPYQKFSFRTRRSFIVFQDNVYSTSTSSQEFQYYPQFEFPAGTSLIVESPKCYGDSTVIKIPYTGTTDYTLTIKGPNAWDWGSNPQLLGCPKETINGISYYCLSKKMDPGDYVLNIENKADANTTPCPFSDTITVTSAPPFIINNVSYPDKSGNYEIPSGAEKGRVTFNVSGSPDQAITVWAGTESFSRTLTGSSGSVTILLSAGTYSIWVTSSSCTSNIIENVTLNASAAISFTATSDSVSCNETNLLSGNCTDGKITISDISGGIGNYTYQIDSGSPVTVQSVPVVVNGQSAGAHTVTVKDGSGSSSTKSVTVAAPDPITVTYEGAAPTMACSEDGKVTLSASGGTSPYKYGISTTDLTASNTLTGLSNGSHKVYVIDAKGCTVEVSVEVPGAPTSLYVIFQTPTAPSCNGSGDDGQFVFKIGNVQGALSAVADVNPANVTIKGDTVTITGLQSGYHVCTIKDEKDGKTCSMEVEYTIPSDEISISAETTATSAVGVSDGQIAVNVTGSDSGAPFRIVLYDVDANTEVEETTNTGSFTFTGLSGSSANGGKLYRITAYNSKGCSATTEVRVSEPGSAQALQLSTIVIPTSAVGVSDGRIAVSVSGGSGAPFRIVLYDVDANTEVEETTNTGNFTFTGLSGSTVNGGKLYRITAYDSEGGSVTTEVLVREPSFIQGLQLFIVVDREVSCHGSNDAAVRLSAQGGQGSYLYSRDSITWDVNTYYAGLSAGRYTFYAKDASDSIVSATVNIKDAAQMILIRDSISHVLCQGSSTGMIRFRISGGSSPYTLLPARGKITQSIVKGDTLITVSELPAGIYTFSVRDSRNCTVAARPDTITEPGKLNVVVSNLVQPTCGWDNGSLSTLVDGGIAPYTYMIIATDAGFIQTKTSREAVIFDNIPGGSYRISVTDSVGCFAQSAVVTLKKYISPSVDSCSVSNPTCAGGNNGRIKVTPLSGMNPVVSFEIYNADSTYINRNDSGVFMNLRAGNYSVVVYDSIGCRSQLPYSVTMREPEPMLVVIDAMVPPANKGSNDGKIYFRILGGNPGRRTARLLDTGMSAVDEISAVNGAPLSFSVYGGDYYLQITDEKGCSVISDLIPVREPDEKLHLIIKEANDALCKSQTGSIIVEGAGGWGGYRYRRAAEDQYSSLNRFENLYPGSYVITVIDRMGATASATIVINEPQDFLNAEIVNQVIPTCGNNGRLSIRLSGGTPPYRFYETNDTTFCSGPQTIERTGMGSGAYLFHLLDANGCRFELEAELPETNLLHITGFDRTYPRTAGGSDGSISASVEGGNPPYTYRWTNLEKPVAGLPGNTARINNVPAGYYLFEVSDAGGCSAKETVYLYDPDGLYFTVRETGDEKALHASNGYAILDANVDIVTYTIISPSLNTFTYSASSQNNMFRVNGRTVYLQNLESGKWFISGTTASGKQVIGEFEIKPFVDFGFGRTVVTDVSAPGASDGTIRVEVYGGGGGNTFVWKDSSGTALYSMNDEYGSVLSGIPAGKYTVEVTDRYGNKIVQTIEVPEPAQALQLSVIAQQNQSCSDSKDAYVVLEAGGGWGDYQFRHEPATDYNNASSFPGLATGNNTFYVIDKRGTIASLTVQITAPEPVRSAIAQVDAVKCKDGFDGRVVFAITGGTAPYSFKESGRDYWQAGNEARNLQSGIHTFTFKDSNDCEGQDVVTVYVPEPDPIVFENVTVTQTTCARDNGQISVTVRGGTPPYTYRWVDFNNREIGNTPTITDLKQNGVYRLEVTDANGCTQQIEQLIQPSSIPRILQVETSNVLCYGESNGTARVTGVEAGQPYSPYTITWSNGKTGDYADGFSEGQYSVTIADGNGCSSVYYFNIGQPDPLQISFIDVREPHCYDYKDAYIHTETMGGVAPYTYLWSTGATTPNLDSIPKGDYRVRVTDANGCSDTRQVTLNEPPYLSVDLGEDIQICPGNTYTVDGGEYAAYRWFTETGDVGKGRYLGISKGGHYFLEATTPDGCPAWGDIRVSIGNDALIADLLLASEAAVGDTLVIFELSNLPLDSMRWEYDRTAFEQLTPTGELAGLPYVLMLHCLQEGLYNVELYGYSGGCYSPAVKQVEVMPASERKPDNWYTIQPMITSLKQYPNPSNGRFTVELELREKAEARLILFEIASGVSLDQKTVQGSNQYLIEYNLSHLNPGVYVLMVTVGNERKQIKLIIQ